MKENKWASKTLKWWQQYNSIDDTNINDLNDSLHCANKPASNFDFKSVYYLKEIHRLYITNDFNDSNEVLSLVSVEEESFT